MSFESDWFDILNHPPHHLTRWNLEAYRRLARMLNLGMRSYFPRSTALNRTVAVFRLLQYGPNRRVRKLRFVKDLMRHAWTLCRLYRRQATRPKSNGGVAADVILVELTVP